MIPASTEPISVEQFDYKADGDLLVDTDLNGIGLQVSSLISRNGTLLLDDPTAKAARSLILRAETGDITATDGDTL